MCAIRGTVNRDVNKTWRIPFVFAAMLNRTENSCSELFSKLNKFAIGHEIYFDTNLELEMIIDFMKAALNTS